MSISQPAQIMQNLRAYYYSCQQEHATTTHPDLEANRFMQYLQSAAKSLLHGTYPGILPASPDYERPKEQCCTCQKNHATTRVPACNWLHCEFRTEGNLHGTYSGNLPADPHHEGPKEVAWQVLDDREGSGKHNSARHTMTNSNAALVISSSEPSAGLTEDVAACEAGACHCCCHIGPACNNNLLLRLSLLMIDCQNCVQQSS